MYNNNSNLFLYGIALVVILHTDVLKA